MRFVVGLWAGAALSAVVAWANWPALCNLSPRGGLELPEPMGTGAREQTQHFDEMGKSGE